MPVSRRTILAVSFLASAAGFWWLAARPQGVTYFETSSAAFTNVPAARPESPKGTNRASTGLEDFSEWLQRYATVEPARKAELEDEGRRLAQARRLVFKELIRTDPRRALQEAVPMVLRHRLPLAIVSQLEERINGRADVFVYQGVPAEGEPLPQETLTHRIATFSEEKSYVAHVFGQRAQDVLGTRNDALNGVAIDNQMAVNDEPVRLMEAGERPDPAKTVLTACPVSGKEVVSGEAASEPIPADVTVVETPEQVVYLCGGYHRSAFTSLLYGEGATGGPTPVTGILPAAPTPALGMVKVLFIPMTFADQNAVPTPEAKCYQIMRDVADYYAKSSYGKLTTLTTVTPPVKLPHNEAWYVQKDTSNGGTVDGLSLEMAHAREEARRLGYDWQDYDCTVLRLNGGPRVVGGWGGTGNVWIYSDGVGVTAHEIGHSFALSHANFWDTAGTSAIGAGTNAEYGDIFDVMGQGSVPIDHYNAQAKNQVKWLPNDFISDITQSGTYRVHAFDQPILDPANRYAIRIVKDTQRVYWGEVRQLYNGHASRPWADKGMILGWRFPASTSNGATSNVQLIDTTPGSPFIKDDAAIAVGQTFSDHESNIHITTVDVSSTTPKYVDVVVNMGAFPDNHSPTLALSASAQVVPTNATVIFTATASDPDGDVLAYAWQHFGDTNVRIASTNSSTISRTFPTQGIYVVSCTVSDMKGGTATRNQLIMVGNGGGRFTISGRVTSGGTGVPNVIVNANGGNAVVTDTDGHYIIPNLSANTYSMTPLLYGQTFSEVFNNSVTVGPSFTGADFVAEAIPRVSLVAATATAQEPGSGTGVVSGVFTITRTGDTSQPLTVFANALGGTATLASDYTYLPTYVSASQGFNTFTIPEESATLDIVVTPQSDAAAEGPETVVLQLGPGNGYVVTSPSEGSITINDDPLDSSLPKVSLSVTAARTFENSAVPARIRFARTGQPTAALAVNYSVTGTATGGVDYPSLTGSVTIPIGAAAAEVEILSLNDSEVEAVETVTLTATADPTYLIQSGANSGTVTIADDDVPTVTVIAPDTVATEVDLAVAGAQADTGTFVVSRTGNTSQPLTVYYALSGPTAGEAALHGVDYEALAGVVVIPAGAESTVISIIPRWDNLGEGTEWVTLNLGAGPTNYKLGNSNAATVELRDAITNPATVEVIGFTPTPAEPSTNGSFRFTVRAPTAAPLTVNFTLSGSASVNSDYSMTGLNTATLEGSVTITPSVTAPVSQNVTVTIVNDGAAEDLENLTLTITPNAAYQTFGPTGSATLWMKDDDQATVFVDPHVTTYPPAVAETAGAVAFYLSRTGSTTSALTVNYLLSGTALNGVDYDNGAGTALSGSAVIPVGSAGVDVTVRPVDDGLFEGAETIVLTLAPGNYGLGPPATLYLSDNEAATQTVAFESSGNTGSESVSSVSIPVSLSAPATAPVSVEYMVDSGTRTSTTVTSAVAPVFPYWVRVERVGTVITSYQSPDGVVWTQRGSANTGMSTTYTAGLAVTSGQSGVQNTAVFDNVSVANLSVGGAAGSLTAVTVGTVNPAATNSENSGVYTISAGGGGIGGTADAGFRYLYFPISNSANCAITARVVSQTAGSATRAGVMIRQSTATNSMFLGALTQLNGALLHYSRMVTGGGTSPATFTTQLRPLWVRLQRAGNLLTASQSPDGVSWTTVGSPQTMALPGEVLAGLAVSARNDSLVTTATFDNVSLTGEPVLTGRTVGYVNSQGSDSVTGGVHTVSAGGALIGGLEDECHFVAAPMTGDFTLRARVVSHSGGAANAQAGVMVRENGNYRSRSVYVGSVANAAVESISRNGSVSTAFGSGVDYSLPMGVLNFGMGEMTQNIVVDVVNDTLAEPDEVFAITLRNANGAQIGSLSQFTYALLDDESTPPLPSVGFALSATSVAETEAAADLTVTLSGASAQPVSVDCAVTGGTATAGSDFVLTLSGITFAPGETVKQIPVALWDDALLENSETMTVTLGNAVNATLGSQLAHTLTLIDDEFPVVTVVATDPNAAEAGLDEGTFTFYRTGPTTSTLTVNYGVGGTAVSGSDRQDIGTSVTFAIGSGTALRQVTPLGDVANEGPETVILTVGPDAAYTVGAPSTATVTIADDDRSTVTIVADDPSASETTGNPGRFTVTRTVPTTAALNVPISISGTATNGTDYATISTTVSFTAGQSSRTINVVPVDDGVTEGPEVVTISLGSGLFQSGTSNFANVTIEDNDSPPTIFISSPGSQGPLVAGGNGVMLGCTVSDDGAPQPVTLTWTQAGGPGLAVFEAPTQSTTGVTFSSDGVYVLKVTANDGQFSVSDQITVVVGAAIAPAEWITQDMTPISARRGQTQSLAGVHSLTATGVGYAGTNDGAHVMMRQITGDGSVVARLGSLTGGATSIAGVSIRDSLYRGARRAVLGYMAGTGLQFRTRTTANATDTVATQAGVTLPAWVRLERNSATGEITASYAADAGGAPGVWTGVGVPTVVGMDNTALFGLTASSGSTTASSTAAFDNLALAPAGDGPALLTEDAGSGNPTAGTFAESNGTYTIGGSGALDGGGYFAGRQYVGDLVITAKLADATSGATSAKSGIMIRESLDSGAYVFLGRITSSSFSGYLWRTIAAGSGGGVPSFTGKVRWMRLVRQGNRVTAFHAPDVGGSPGAWIQLGQPQTVIMSPVVHVGFCVDNSGGVGLNVATFTNLTVVPLNKAPIINPGSVTPPVIATASLGGTVSDDGYPAPPNLSVLWNQLSGPAPVVFGNPSLPPTSAQFGADGPYRLRLSASDGSAETFADLTFDAYTRRYGVWQAAHFSGGSSNPDSGADADPDRDSLSNLLEYALATGPNAAGASPVVKDVVTVGTERFLRLTVSKNAAAPEVLYVVEATGELTNPASWSSAGLVVEQNDANTLRVRDHVPMNGGNRRFMRVWVHLP